MTRAAELDEKVEAWGYVLQELVPGYEEHSATLLVRGARLDPDPHPHPSPSPSPLALSPKH